MRNNTFYFGYGGVSALLRMWGADLLLPHVDVSGLRVAVEASRAPSRSAAAPGRRRLRRQRRSGGLDALEQLHERRLVRHLLRTTWQLQGYGLPTVDRPALPCQSDCLQAAQRPNNQAVRSLRFEAGLGWVRSVGRLWAALCTPAHCQLPQPQQGA